MTDLRTILGDKYDDVIERALTAADKGGYYVTRPYMAAHDALAAVLPDLLARAYARGFEDGCTWTNAIEKGDPYTPEPANPYCQTEGNRA